MKSPRLLLFIATLSIFNSSAFATTIVPVVYQCPNPTSLQPIDGGNYAATTVFNNLTVNWYGIPNHYVTPITITGLKGVFLECNSGSQGVCKIRCSYTTNQDYTFVNINPSLKNPATYEAIPGGYGPNWENNQCMKEYTSDCQFQVTTANP